MENLRRRLIKELQDEVAKENAQIKALRDKISAEMFCRSTITGGAFSTSARNKCDQEADAARKDINRIEQESMWKKEMLSKYNTK